MQCRRNWQNIHFSLVSKFSLFSNFSFFSKFLIFLKHWKHTAHSFTSTTTLVPQWFNYPSLRLAPLIRLGEIWWRNGKFWKTLSLEGVTWHIIFTQQHSINSRPVLYTIHPYTIHPFIHSHHPQVFRPSLQAIWMDIQPPPVNTHFAGLALFSENDHILEDFDKTDSTNR